MVAYVSEKVGNIKGSEENASYQHFSALPIMILDVFPQHINTLPHNPILLPAFLPVSTMFSVHPKTKFTFWSDLFYVLQLLSIWTGLTIFVW